MRCILTGQHDAVCEDPAYPTCTLIVLPGAVSEKTELAGVQLARVELQPRRKYVARSSKYGVYMALNGNRKADLLTAAAEVGFAIRPTDAIIRTADTSQDHLTGGGGCDMMNVESSAASVT